MKHTIKKLIIITIVILLLAQGVLAQWSFTEVMYDPQGSDSNKEWVELVGPALDSSIKFIEGSSAHNINLVAGSCTATNCILIIADDANYFINNFNVSNSTLVYDSSWSSLRNTGETIAIQQDTITIVSFDYPAIAPQPNSLQFIDNTWSAALPSPGKYEEVQQDSSTNISTTNNNGIPLADELDSIEVPEFSVIAATLILGCIALFVVERRK